MPGERADRRDVWYSPTRRAWWLEPRDNERHRAWLLAHEDAIQVTNAYEVLPPEFLADLQQKADA